jgi:hypothetical protein
MEYILNNTDIFDPATSSKIRMLMKENNISKDENKFYSISILFNVNLLESEKLEHYFYYYIIDDSYQEGEKIEYIKVIHSVLGHILGVIVASLEDQINISSSIIKGSELDSENTVIIGIREGTPTYLGRGKNRRVYSARTIIPDARAVNKISEKDKMSFISKFLLKEKIITHYEYSKMMECIRKIK